MSLQNTVRTPAVGAQALWRALTPHLSRVIRSPGLTFSDRALPGPAVVVAELTPEDLDSDRSTFCLGLLGRDRKEKHVTKEAFTLWVSTRGEQDVPLRGCPLVWGLGNRQSLGGCGRGWGSQAGASCGELPTLSPPTEKENQVPA